MLFGSPESDNVESGNINPGNVKSDWAAWHSAEYVQVSGERMP